MTRVAVRPGLVRWARERAGYDGKIPNACIGLGLSCISPYEMLRRERARFVLGPTPRAA